jgi:hypothetical protein
MNKKLLASGAALIALGVASGTAFTSSISTPAAKTAGYSDLVVTGATVENVNFGYSADGSEINKVTIVFSADLGTKKVTASFKGTGLGQALSTSTQTLETAEFDGLHVPTKDVTGLGIAVAEADDTIGSTGS